MRSVLSDLEERLDEPSARALAHAVTAAVRDGVLAPGDRLPPIRTVAAELALSPTTVSAAWAQLARSGVVRSDGRRGTTVLGAAPARPGRYEQALERPAPFALDLSTGVPDEALLPSLEPALRSLTTAGTPGSYLDAPVLPELAEVLRAQWPYAAPELAVVDGAMDAMDLLARGTLRFGDRVVVEHPCFPPLVDLLESLGVQVVPVRVDAEGLSADGLREALASPVAAAFLQPRAQNPTGVGLTPRRAKALARLLERTSTLVVEDDAASAPPDPGSASLAALLPGQSVHLRSFSKTHGPDLRLAALSAPPDVLRTLAAQRRLGQGWSSRLLQRILLSLLTDPASVAAVERAAGEYARRRTAVVEGLAARGVEVGGTEGINLWVPVHDETAAVVRLSAQGIGVAPGAPFSLLPGDGDHVRVTVGLVREGHDELAEQLALAARTPGWGGRGR
ncbi:MAG TPA: aminotransferase class I/II-fold pyridoxal phosphate-dependent enzyme [Pedococcus sp.]